MKGDLRINKILKLKNLDFRGDNEPFEVEKMPTEYGLAIEYGYDDEHYIVVTFVKYNEKEDAASIDWVRNTVVDEFSDELLIKWRDLVKEAVIDVNIAMVEKYRNEKN